MTGGWKETDWEPNRHHWGCSRHFLTGMSKMFGWVVLGLPSFHRQNNMAVPVIRATQRSIYRPGSHWSFCLNFHHDLLNDLAFWNVNYKGRRISHFEILVGGKKVKIVIQVTDPVFSVTHMTWKGAIRKKTFHANYDKEYKLPICFQQKYNIQASEWKSGLFAWGNISNLIILIRDHL